MIISLSNPPFSPLGKKMEKLEKQIQTQPSPQLPQPLAPQRSQNPYRPPDLSDLSLPTDREVSVSISEYQNSVFKDTVTHPPAPVRSPSNFKLGN